MYWPNQTILLHRFKFRKQGILHGRNTMYLYILTNFSANQMIVKSPQYSNATNFTTNELTTKIRLEIEQYFNGLQKTYSAFGLNIVEKKI